MEAPAFKKKQTILIVDDSAMNRALLADMIGDEYEILEAENGLRAIGQMQALGTGISLVLLDIVMPEMDGFDVLAVMNRHGWIKDIPVIMVSSESASTYIERAYELGVTDFISRPFDANIVRRRVLNTTMLYAKQKALIGMVADQIYEREKGNSLMVAILSHIVEFRNGESGLHVLHVGAMTELLLNHIIQKTDRYQITPSDISLIAMASSLHDIGKISIPDEVLNKPGRLTDEEFDLMKKHTVIGAEMLDDLPTYRDEPLVRLAYQITRWHHERYDGRGYPDGLVGDDIPIAAQVVALADVYDALTSKRVYKDAYSHETAIQMVMDGECGAFNPFLLECLAEVADDVQEELKVASFSDHTDREIGKIVDKVVRPDATSSRTLELLDYERMKYRFFASMSNEIQYEFTLDPPMLTVSDWGKSQLDLDEIILDPLNDERLRSAFGGEILDATVEALHATTPENPVVEHDLQVMVNGEPRWFHSTSRAIWSDDEEPVYHGSIGKLVDITESHERLIDLQYKASHDALTGLLNHASARQAIIDRMEVSPEGNFVFMILDLDFFKEANDTRGHQFGDEVLRHFSRRLLASVRDRDIVARVGGDEFLICLVDCHTEPEPLVDRVFRSITGEYEGFELSVSMGVACTVGGEYGYDELFRNADAALYDMKRGGRGGYVFSDMTTLEDGKSVLSAIDGSEPDEKE